MVKTTCPVCDEGTLQNGTVKEYLFGVYLGEFPALLCSRCGESFTNQETTRKIEEAAKAKGIWGLGASTKITKAGNSLAVRIPKKIAEHLHWSDGNEAYIHPEGKKLVIETNS